MTYFIMMLIHLMHTIWGQMKAMQMANAELPLGVVSGNFEGPNHNVLTEDLFGGKIGMDARLAADPLSGVHWSELFARRTLDIAFASNMLFAFIYTHAEGIAEAHAKGESYLTGKPFPSHFDEEEEQDDDDEIHSDLDDPEIDEEEEQDDDYEIHSDLDDPEFDLDELGGKTTINFGRSKLFQ